MILAAASVFSSAIATVLAQRTGFRYAIPLAGAVLTVGVIVFCELAPKIYAANNPEGVALHAAGIYRALVWVTRPALWFTRISLMPFCLCARSRRRFNASAQVFTVKPCCFENRQVSMQADFGYLREIVYSHSQNVLDPSRDYLFENRLAKLLRNREMNHLGQLVDELRDKYNRPVPGADLLLSNVYDALMTDEENAKDLGSGVVALKS